jgi:hypothetical protein
MAWYCTSLLNDYFDPGPKILAGFRRGPQLTKLVCRGFSVVPDRCAKALGTSGLVAPGDDRHVDASPTLTEPRLPSLSY